MRQQLDFKRDEHSNALINTNVTALEQRRAYIAQAGKTKDMQSDIEMLKEKIDRIESLILESFKKR